MDQIIAIVSSQYDSTPPAVGCWLGVLAWAITELQARHTAKLSSEFWLVQDGEEQLGKPRHSHNQPRVLPCRVRFLSLVERFHLLFESPFICGNDSYYIKTTP